MLILLQGKEWRSHDSNLVLECKILVTLFGRMCENWGGEGNWCGFAKVLGLDWVCILLFRERGGFADGSSHTKLQSKEV
jgi:hypothetical protein